MSKSFMLLLNLLIVTLLIGCGPQITLPTPTQPPPTKPVSLTTMTPRATLTPAPSTPIPTNSPTPSPTPIIHVLKQGDSLWGIAWDYGVSLEALQKINNITDPRTLQIGQELIIPRQEDDLAVPSTPTPTPVPLKIINMDFYETPTGGLWCLGEVQNLSGADVELVQVRISLYDADRRVLLEKSAFTTLDIIAQDGRAPFTVLFEQKPADFAAYQLWIVSGETMTHLGNRYRELQVINDEGKLSGNAFVVSGQVQNQGELAATDISLVVTAYDKEGLVTGVRQVPAETETVAPGALSRFQARIVPAGGDIVSYSVQVQGWQGE